jgi:hypothetical protein
MKHLCSVLLAVLTTSLVAPDLARSVDPPQQPEETAISYASLDEAIKALRAKPGVTFQNQGGWWVVKDLPAFTVWLLTPPGHPAYPSIVKKTIVNSNNGADMQTDIRCFASKEVCDKYFGSKNAVD